MIKNNRNATKFLETASKNMISIFGASLNKVGFEGRKEMINYINTGIYPKHSRVKNKDGKLKRVKRAKTLGKLVRAVSYYLSATKDAVHIGFPSAKKLDLAYKPVRKRAKKHKDIIEEGEATQKKSLRKPSAAASSIVSTLEKGSKIKVSSRTRKKYERSVDRLKKKTAGREYKKSSIRPLLKEKKEIIVKKRSTIGPTHNRFNDKIPKIFKEAAQKKINQISKRYK